jgi:hypothetical protein
MNLRTSLLGLASMAFAGSADAAAPLPSGWPFTTLQLGLKNDATPASVRTWAPMGLVYQYLTGGAGRSSGWRNWNSPDGQFVTDYIQQAKAAGITPVFTYYQLLYTRAGSGDQNRIDLANLNDAATMQKYFVDFKVLLQKAGAFTAPVVVHVEPDLWGYVQQVSAGDHATSVPAKVASTGLPELSGLPNTAAGFAQGLVRLRGLYAPNVILAYHMSTWGTGVEPDYANPSPRQVTALATRSAAFYQSLEAAFDLTFAEFSDRDEGYKLAVDGVAGAAWTRSDYDNNVRWLVTYGKAAGQRLVMWQIPFGNRTMRTENNQPHHYQSSQVEMLLDDPSRARLKQYRDAGVLAFLFGAGADDQTHIDDFAGDGATNPAAINGNTTASYSPDDDGGLFKREAAAYYAAGPLRLTGLTGSSPIHGWPGHLTSRKIPPGGGDGGPDGSGFRVNDERPGAR